MEQLSFRFAEQSDTPELCRLRLAYFADDFGALPEQLIREISTQLPDYFAEHLGKACIAPVAALPDGTLCACALLNIEIKPANPFFPKFSRVIRMLSSVMSAACT